MKVGDRVVVPWTVYRMGRVLSIDESLDHSFDFQVFVKDEYTGKTKEISEAKLERAQSEGVEKDGITIRNTLSGGKIRSILTGGKDGKDNR